MLRLDKNNIFGPELQVSLAELFGQYSRLGFVSLGECNLGDKGGEVVFQALLSNRTIKAISLTKNMLAVRKEIEINL